MLAKAYNWVENLHRVDREIGVITREAEELLWSVDEMVALNVFIGCLRYLRRNSKINDRSLAIAGIAVECVHILKPEVSKKMIVAVFADMDTREAELLNAALAA